MKRFLGILLSLALVLGLIPGMSLTAYADDEPSVTITPTGGGEVTVTYVSDMDGWSLTATPADGYTFSHWIISLKNGGSETWEELYGIQKSYYDANCNGLTAVFKANHTHSFIYSAVGTTITATCSAEGCGLPEDVDGKHVATLTIAADGGTYNGTTAYGATINDENNIKGTATVSYYEANEAGTDKTGEALSGAPINAGKYWAEITLGTGTNTATAHVVYDIAKADPTITTAPTASDITYGQKLSNSDLTGGVANTDGNFAWKDNTTAPSVSDSQSTPYDVVFTPDDTDNYNTKDCQVKLIVNPKEIGLTWTDTDLTYNGQVQSPKAAATELVSGDADDVNVTVTGGQTDAGTYNLDESPKYKDAGTYTVYFKVSGNDDYSDYEGSATVAISKKPVTANVSAEDKAYDGKTDATVSASVPTEALISGDSIEITGLKGSFDDANVGTDKVVTVDGSAKSIAGNGSGNYEVTIPGETTASISKSEPKITAPGVKELTYNGEALELVSAGTTTGGKIYYAVTTEEKVPTNEEVYKTSIPAATEVGT